MYKQEACFNIENTGLSLDNELHDLNLPYIIDLSQYHVIKNLEFLDHINRVGIEVYKKT